MNRSAINPVSKRRAAKLRERKKMIAAMKREGPVMCGFPNDQPIYKPSLGVVFRVFPCGEYAADLHEPGKRSQGADPSNADSVIPLCREHHIWTTEHPLEATAMGLVAARRARDGVEGG